MATEEIHETALEIQQKVVDYLSKFKNGIACPTCGSSDLVAALSIEPAVVSILPPGAIPDWPKSATLPMIMVVCRSCFHVRFFAKKMILPTDHPAKDE